MEVTVGTRMGGPELGASVLPLMVSIRQALKREWSAIVAPDVQSVDYVLFFNGSITEYFATTGMHSVKYAKSKKIVTVDMAFGAAEAAGASRTELAKLMRSRFSESLDAIAKALEKHGVAFETEVARRAVMNAFLAVDSAA